MAYDRYVRWFSDVSEKDALIVGKKFLDLSRLYKAGFSVPNAFCITSSAFKKVIDSNNLKSQFREIFGEIDFSDYSSLVRSFDEIKKLIMGLKFPSDIEREIIESYDHLNANFGDLTNNSLAALSILKSTREPVFVSIRPSPIDDSFGFLYDSFLNVKGNFDLINKIKECFCFSFSPRVLFYKRELLNDETIFNFSVIVQKMIDCDKAGYSYFLNPVNGKEEILVESAFGNGKGILMGKIVPDIYISDRDFGIVSEKVSDKKSALVRTASGHTKFVGLSDEKSRQKVLKTYEVKSVSELTSKVSSFFNEPKEISFGIQDDKIYIFSVKSIEVESSDERIFDGNIICEGIGSSKGFSYGLCEHFSNIDRFNEISKSKIILIGSANEDFVIGLSKPSGVIGEFGCVSSIFSRYLRKAKIPAVMGLQEKISLIKEGVEISIDGLSGKVFLGKAQEKKREILPICPTKRIKVKAVIDSPKFCDIAVEAGCDSAGLVRIENLALGFFNGKDYSIVESNLENYSHSVKNSLEMIIRSFFKGEVWIKLSEFNKNYKSSDFTFGDYGIRYLLKKPNILKAELIAIKNSSFNFENLGIIIPHVCCVDEIKSFKKVLSEIGLNCKIGVLIDIPASSFLIRDICQEGISFVLIDIDSIAMHTLAVSLERDFFDSCYGIMNWAVLKQISRVSRESHQKKVEAGVFSRFIYNEELLRHLVSFGVDCVVCDLDFMRRVSEKLSEIENNLYKEVVKIEKIDDFDSIKKEIEKVQEEEREEKERALKGTFLKITDETDKEKK